MSTDISLSFFFLSSSNRWEFDVPASAHGRDRRDEAGADQSHYELHCLQIQPLWEGHEGESHVWKRFHPFLSEQGIHEHSGVVCSDVHTLTSVSRSAMEMGEEYEGLEMCFCRIGDVGILIPKDLFNL